MRRRRRAALVMVLAAALSACAGPRSGISERPMFSQVAPGRSIVENRCAVCHGVHGVLYGREAAAPRFAEIRERYSKSELAERLYSVALNGHGKMPPFIFAPGEVDRLVAYIKSAR